MDSNGTAGGSARVEYERRRAARLARHRSRFGRLAPLTARLEGETRLERAWRLGAEGEERSGGRLEGLARERGVITLHDLRIPGTRANIDHVCIGPGGVTVIDTKRYQGKVTVGAGKLWVAGHDRSSLVEGVRRQVRLVETVLLASPLDVDVPVAGVLCWIHPDGLPAFRRLELHGVRVRGPRGTAKLAARPGTLDAGTVAAIAALLGERFGLARTAAVRA